MSIKSSLTLFMLSVNMLFSFNVFSAQTTKISQVDLLALISQPEQSKTVNTEFIVLDVRTPREFKNGHIKGAINISHNTISQNLPFLEQYKDKMVVVYCRSGVRARSAERVLHANGFADLRHLEGNMLGWVSAKLPIER